MSDSTTTGAVTWDEREKHLTDRTSNPNLNYGYNQGQKGNIPSVPPIPPQYLNQMGAMQASRLGFSQGQMQQSQGDNNLQLLTGFLNSPVDIPTLVATKGYNPQHFDIRPQYVGNISRNPPCMSYSLFITGSILCYQIIHRR